MNRTEALRGAGAFSGPAALVIGGSMLTLALTGAGPYRPQAAGPRPAPTVTVTRTPAPAAGRPTGPAPHASPTSARAAETGVLAAAHMPPARAAAPTGRRPGGVTPSGPSPAPTASMSSLSSCGGPVLSLRLLRAACVSVGR